MAHKWCHDFDDGESVVWSLQKDSEYSQYDFTMGIDKIPREGMYEVRPPMGPSMRCMSVAEAEGLAQRRREGISKLGIYIVWGSTTPLLS